MPFFRESFWRSKTNAGSAPRPRQGGHPNLALLHARAPDVSVTGVVRRSQLAIKERELYLGWVGTEDADAGEGVGMVQRYLLGGRN